MNFLDEQIKKDLDILELERLDTEFCDCSICLPETKE
jgi:hypothetical protein